MFFFIGRFSVRYKEKAEARGVWVWKKVVKEWRFIKAWGGE